MCVHSTNPSLLGAEIPASYQEDRSPQKILCPGRMPDSESREPAGTNNFLPLLLRGGKSWGADPLTPSVLRNLEPPAGVEPATC